MKIYLTIISLLFIYNLSFASGIKFLFDNGIVTGEEKLYYEFDIMVEAQKNDTSSFGDALVYFDYDTLAFGSYIVRNEKIFVAKGAFITDKSDSKLPLYEIVNVIDNTAYKLAIAIIYNYADSPSKAKQLMNQSFQLLHIALKIKDNQQYTGLVFDENLMSGQQYKSDNQKKYESVIAGNSDNSSLNDLTSISSLDDQIPKHFEISQNYPNPFNPTATIKYGVPKKAHVVIEVFNVLGQKVAVLVNEEKQAGYYKVRWNGKNQSGNVLASGLFFYRIKAEKYVKTKKMILLK